MLLIVQIFCNKNGCIKKKKKTLHNLHYHKVNIVHIDFFILLLHLNFTLTYRFFYFLFCIFNYTET